MLPRIVASHCVAGVSSYGGDTLFSVAKCGKVSRSGMAKPVHREPGFYKTLLEKPFTVVTEIIVKSALG